jgi:hypothetical protein
MSADKLAAIIELFRSTRARQIRLAASERTMEEMARLPPHLIDDVNARGLPLDHREPANQNRTPRTSSVKKAYGNHNIYSLD